MSCFGDGYKRDVSFVFYEKNILFFLLIFLLLVSTGKARGIVGAFKSPETGLGRREGRGCIPSEGAAFRRW
jgi:hypothetical protein